MALKENLISTFCIFLQAGLVAEEILRLHLLEVSAIPKSKLYSFRLVFRPNYLHFLPSNANAKCYMQVI